MQATITYLLTEQAQRAQMAVTGQPVARKQTVTVELPNEHAAVLQIGEDGAPYLDLTGPYPGPRYEHPSRGDDELILYWRDLLKMSPISGADKYGIRSTNYLAGFEVFSPDFPALIAAAASSIEADIKYNADYPASVLAADERLAAWVSSGGSSSNYGDNIWREAIEGCGLKPTDSRLYKSGYLAVIVGPKLKQATVDYLAVKAEALQAKRSAQLAEEEERRAAKKANEADREKTKLDFIAAWIAEHGSGSQEARQADGLLCRDEAIAAIADQAFEPLDGFVRYTKDSRPTPKCRDEACEGYGEGCQTKHSVEDSVECLSESEHAVYTAIRAAMPDDTKYILRTHSVIHDCDHNGGCERGSNHAVMVKAIVGPFTLQREYAL